MVDLFITGADGQLGRAITEEAGRRGLTFEGHDLDTMDIRDPEIVARLVRAASPRTLINCAAATAVDACEDDPEAAAAVNGDAVGNLAAACNGVGARLIQVSTDYVFDGTGDQPYTEDDAPNPRSAYGRSKLRGERLARVAERHLVVRTAWLYGRGGRNFVEAIRGQLAHGAHRLTVVADQVGTPTLADDLAAALLDLDRTPAVGVVHAVNEGSTSWHGFAAEIVRRLGADAEVVPVRTSDYPRPAPRPAYSVLDTSRLRSLIARPMPSWQDALGRYLGSACAS